MLQVKDNRYDYGETRWMGLGLLEQRVMVVVYTERHEDVIRIISCRKANQREVKYYEEATTQNE